VIDRIVQGEVPRKHHLALRDAAGRLRHEEAHTRAGFDGPYTLAYHLHRPHATHPAETTHGWAPPGHLPPRRLARRHYLTPRLVLPPGPAVDARVALLWSADLSLGIAAPTAEDPVYFRNADGDEVFFVQEGGGLLRSPLGGASTTASSPARARSAGSGWRWPTCTCRRSGATRPASSAWTPRTATATSAASRGSPRATRGCAISW